MKCSIAILNWNGANYLRQFLPQVVRSCQNKDYEVVVADNGSTDDSLAYLQTLPTVRTLVFDQNYGFAEGYNRTLAQIEAEYTVLLNSDVWVSDNWLEPLLDYMDQHPKVAACQPKVLSYNSKKEFDQGKVPFVTFEHAGAAGGYMDAWGYPYCRGRILGYVEQDKGQYDTVAPIFWATGACLCIRTQVYQKEGGLDARFFAHMEEIDLCWRLQCRNYECACVPQSVIYHVGGGALAYENPRKTFLNFRNNLLMLYKNLPKGKLGKVLTARFFLDYAAALQYLCQGKIGNFKAVFQARRAFHKLKKEFAPSQAENRQKAVVPYPATIANRSIVWDYLRGKRN